LAKPNYQYEKRQKELAKKKKKEEKRLRKLGQPEAGSQEDAGAAPDPASTTPDDTPAA
jgi:hypothetical protein